MTKLEQVVQWAAKGQYGLLEGHPEMCDAAVEELAALNAANAIYKSTIDSNLAYIAKLHNDNDLLFDKLTAQQTARN